MVLSTNNRLFFVSLLPFVQDIDRLAFFHHVSLSFHFSHFALPSSHLLLFLLCISLSLLLLLVFSEDHPWFGFVALASTERSDIHGDGRRVHEREHQRR